MSTTIDERVVEMRFDNKQFESNVSTSMSTLKKLKESLKFTGATKGLEEIDAASKRVNMSGLGSAVDSVKAKFSAMDVVAVTALANITNSAVNAGKRLISSLSVDQISAGWNKFGEKTTSVATLVAQGNAIEDVNKQLDLLNWFTDETSYNFTDMVANIAKFTASGKGLEESVTAMEGIATWAALSGQNAMTASRAMYQLSQAMGAGVMRREDYRSIQNASMDTKEFRENCIEAAIALGTLKDNGDGTYTSMAAGAKKTSFTISQFADNLTDGLWLTSDVMMSVYTKYASAVNAIYEAVEEKGFDNASQVLTEIHDKADQLKTGAMTDAEAIDAAIKELGYTLEDGSLKFDHFGVKAFEAAQQARTFRDVIDSVKDAVSTGWMNTFEKIFGDSEQATKMWTMMANELWTTFAGGGERRNNILDQAMGSGWDKLSERISGAGFEMDAYESKVKELAKAGGADIDSLVSKYGSLGDVFKNGALDTKYLTDALSGLGKKSTEASTEVASALDKIKWQFAFGSEGKSVENLQTALVGLGYNLDENGVNGKFGSETQAALKAFQKDAGITVTGVVDSKTLAALKEAAKSIETVGDASEEAQVNIDDLLESISRPSGRELLFDTISNSLQLINGVLGAFRDAWGEVFSEEGVASGLYNGLKAVKEFTDGFFELDKEGNRVLKNFDKLKSTFKGLISVLDIVVSLVGGAVKFVFQTLGVIFGNFNLSILDATAGVGDFLVMLSETIKEGEYIGKAFSWLLGKVTTAVIALKKWIGSLFGDIKKSSAFRTIEKAYQKFSVALKLFREGKIGVSELTVAVKKFLGVINDAITPIKNFTDTISKWFEAFKNLPSVQAFVKAVNDISDAFSKFFNGEIDPAEFGAALGKALANFLKSIPNIVKEVANSLWQTAKQIATDFLAGFQNGLKTGIGGIISNIVEFCLNFVSSFAEALGVQSPSWKAFQIMCDFIQGAINGIKAMLGPLLKALQPVGEAIVKVFKSFWSFITDENGDIEWGKLISGAITIESLLILNRFTKALDKFASAATSFSGIITGVTSLINELKLGIQRLSKSVARDFNMNALMKLAIAIGILVASVVLIAKVGGDDYLSLWNAVGIIGALAIILGVLAIAMDKLAAVSIKWDKGPQLEGIKSGLIQIGIALLLVAAVVKVIGGMDPEQAKQGFIGLAAMTVGMIIFLKAIGGISTYAGDVSGFAKTLTGLGVAMLLLAVVIKIIGKMDPYDLVIGVVVMEALTLFCIQMAIANRFAGQYDDGSMFLKLAISLGILVVVMKMIRKLSPDDVIKGVVVMQMFAILLIEMAVANQIAGGEVGKFSSVVISMSFSMLLMAGVLKILAKLDPAVVDKGIHVMQKFLILLAEMILISKIAGKETAKIATIIIGMAIAIGILVGVVYLLDQMKDVDMKKPLAVIAGLGACMTAMIWATRGASNVRQNIIALTTAVGVMAAAVVALSFIEGKDLAKATGALFSLMIAFALMTKMASGISAEDVSIKAVGWLLVLTGIVGIMTGIVIALSKLSDPKAAIANAAAVSLLLLTMAGVMRILSKTGDISKDVIKNLTPMILTVGAIAVILAILSSFPKAESMIADAVALSILLNSMASAMLIMGKAGKISKTVSNQIGPLTLAIGGLAIVLGILSSFPKAESMIADAIALGILLNTMASAMVIMGKAGRVSKTVTDQIGSMVFAIGGLAIVLGILSSFPKADSMITNAVALGILLNALASAMVILGFVGPNAAMAVKPAMLMGVVLGEIAGVLILLKVLDVNPSIETAVSLSMLLLALSAACLIASRVPSALAIDGALGLAAFIGVMAGVVTAAGLLSKIPGFNDILADGGESLRLIGTAIGNFVGGIAGGVVSGAGAAIISLLPTLGQALSDFMDGAQGFLDSASSVGSDVIKGAGYIAGAILALSGAGFISGVLGMMSLGSGSLVGLGIQLAVFGLGAKKFTEAIDGIDSSSVEAAESMADMLLTLSKADLLSGITKIFGGQLDFSTMSANLVSFGEAVVSFSDTISGKIDVASVEAATSAGNMLVALNKALPRSGGWVQDIIGEKDFDKFTTACASFAECILSINAVLSQNGFEIQSEKIEQLTKAGTQFSDLNNALPRSGGIVQDYIGEQDLAAFGTACMAFAGCILSINDYLNSNNIEIDSKKIAQLTKAGEQFSDLNNALPRAGGVAQDLAGEQDLSVFGEACAAFATCMIGVNSAVSQEGFSVNLEAIDQLKQAGDKMNELQGSLPKTGGWWEEIAGSQDIGDFGAKIRTFATAIVDFSTSASNLNTGAIDTAIGTAEKMKDFLASLVGIDYSGVASFTGVGTGGFGADGPIYKVGKAITAFSTELDGINTENINVAVNAATRLKTLITGLVGLNTSGVKNFDPQPIGTSLKGYSDQISEVDIGIVSSSISVVYRLKSLISSFSGLDDSGVAKFKIVPIATNLKSYSASVAGVNASAVSSSVNAATKLKTFIAGLAGLDTSGAETFKAAVASLSTLSIGPLVESLSAASKTMYTSGTAMIGMLVKAFNEGASKVSTSATKVVRIAKTKIESEKSSFTTAGRSLISSFASGLSSSDGTISSNASTAAYNAVTGARTQRSNMYQAGVYVLEGFRNGLQDPDMLKSIYYSGRKAGREAVNGVNAGAKNRSPSKATRQSGIYVGEGFVLGMESMYNNVRKSGTELGASAINGTRSAMTTLLDTLNTDMDMQPTIRPVVDLSDVRTGAAAVSGIFGNVQTVGVRSNLNAINLAMNSRSQNRSNADIISAINKLGDGLANNRGDTYNFGDFTYDDGSNVANAVGELIRYAKIGRRV